MRSPCILVCQIDMTSGLCFGCGRTRDEIAIWASLSDHERDTIMAQLPERLSTVERRPRRMTRRRASSAGQAVEEYQAEETRRIADELRRKANETGSE